MSTLAQSAVHPQTLVSPNGRRWVVVVVSHGLRYYIALIAYECECGAFHQFSGF